MYIKKEEGNLFIVSRYVDDIIFIGSNEKMVEDFEDVMTKEFEMTDLRLMKYFLGLEIRQRDFGIFMSEEA